MGTSNDCFVATLQKILKEQGRGAKKKLAASVDISPNHLSDILGQRKNAGQKLKERIADRLNTSLEGMLALGRHIGEGQKDAVKGNTSKGDHGRGAADALGQHESPDVNQFLGLAAQVLESNTPYRQALINNLIAFHNALESKNKEEKALQMITSLQEEIKTMRRDIEELKLAESGEDDLTNTAAA